MEEQQGGNVVEQLIRSLWIIAGVAAASLPICIAVKWLINGLKPVLTPGEDSGEGLRTCKAEDAAGVVIGRKGRKTVCLPMGAEGHIAVIGGSGSGKTSAIVIPTLKAWGKRKENCPEGHLFSIDISGDISGHDDSGTALIFDPFGDNGSPYDVFAVVDDLPEADRPEALERLAYLIMPQPQHLSAEADFFLGNGRRLLTAALWALYPSGLDFVDICRTILSHDSFSLCSIIDKCEQEKASILIANFASMKESTISSCKDSCDRAIKLFATDDRIARSVRRPKKDEAFITARSIEVGNVYIKIPEERLDVYAPLLHLLVALQLDYLYARPIKEPRILIILDEYASLGDLDIIGPLRRIRKRGVTIMICLQSLADLDALHGPVQRRAIMDNIGFCVVLGVSDPESQRYFAERIGEMLQERTSKTRTVSHAGTSRSRTEAEVKDYAIPPEVLGRLKDDLLLIYPGGHMMLRKAYFFKNNENNSKKGNKCSVSSNNKMLY